MRSDIIWSFIFGCFLILILYHIVYFFLTKDNTYLFYCLFVFAVSFPFLTLIKDLVNLPSMNALLFFSVSGLFAAFYFQLTRNLLNLQKLSPKWDKILNVSIKIKIILVLVYTLVYLLTHDIFVILIIYIPTIFIELILMILLSVALIRTRNRIAMLFVLGSSLAWVGMFLSIILADPEYSFTPQMEPFKFATPAIGFVLESLFFAMVLSYRSKLNEIAKKQAQDGLIEQLEKNRILQENINRDLELKVAERTKTIEMERQKSENLLLNTLPVSIVEEMKATGKSVPRRYDEVSVLFGDFINFTAFSDYTNPEIVVQKLDYFFSNFDNIIAKHGLEKIKTIGDAYMCVCGLPQLNTQHLKNTILAALELQVFLSNFNANIPENEYKWQMRIGVQTGPTVAGVIGKNKFAYDIWGDTVNTASRLEHHSEAGKINISQQVYDLICDDFDCTARGCITVKNKGDLFMYFVNGPKMHQK
jgi:class 3 adenylate cyclase